MLQSVLHQYWGYDRFRPFQEEIIKAVLDHKDVMAVLPTGAGKSLCYQLPAMVLDGYTLVVSPLIALMQDQVMQLQIKGIPAAAVHSGLSREQQYQVLNDVAAGDIKILYLAPERVAAREFHACLGAYAPALIAIDEAHCISQWGHDFRPAYRRLSELRGLYPQTPVLAITASATARVQADVIQQLLLRTPLEVKQTVVRPNLFYHIRYTENKFNDLVQLLSHKPGSSIVYLRSRKGCEDMARHLKQHGLDAHYYHAGLSRNEREVIQETWTQSDRKIICATTAFGMGIDKPDVGIVAHIDLPDQLEAYYQEAGRAGRDGKKAFAVLFYNHQNIVKLRSSTERHYPDEAFIRKVYQALGDYLQVPYDSGMNNVCSFDVVAFCRNFDLDMPMVINALRILEREGFWEWSQHAQTRSMVRFTTDRVSLQQLARTNPKLSALATAMLRLYGSIFNFLTPIRVYDIARMLEVDKVVVEQGLKHLASLGFIDYQPAFSGNTLYWMHQRARPKELRLDTGHMQQLRAAHEERIAHMISFITDTSTCRNRLLAAYFDVPAPEDCGGCDVCKARKSDKIDDLKARVLEVIRRERQLSIQSLMAYFPEADSGAIIDYIRVLGDEQLCRIYPTGIIFAT